MSKGRKKAFDQQQALAAMTRVFWEKGYDGASYDDLVKGSGVQRYGLYSSFGDKRNAFIHCLDFYIDRITRESLAPMRREGAGLQALKTYFEVLLQTHKDTAWGCLVCNSVSEKITDCDAQVKALIQAMFSLLEDSLKNALAGARQQGEIPPGLDIPSTAHYLLGMVIGSAVMARSAIDKQAIEDFINMGFERLQIGAAQ